jgi:EAL domain-containing protein (putative c-di-GMP-specific phosphodiesterase class I)
MAEAKRTGGARYVVFEATVRVADSLGMSTVAEGIETEAQAAVIQQLGCQRGQGYLFSKPLDAAEIPAWLTHVASIPA